MRKHDVAHWKVGTRVVITEEGDMHTGKAGRLMEYRGRGWYAVLMEDGHKVTFSPMQWERMANQKGNCYTPLPGEGIRAAHRVLELAEGKYAVARDGSPGHFATPASGKGWKKKSGTGGDVGMETTNTTSAASQWNPPAGTRVRIIRTYGGVMLPKDEIRTGETHMFAHGWYYITLDDGGKQERQATAHFPQAFCSSERSASLAVCICVLCACLRCAGSAVQNNKTRLTLLDACAATGATAL